MTIQSLSSRPREISVTEAIEPAYERVKRVLFRPFDFTKWIIIGFCAWLAGLGESGGGARYNGFNNNSHHHPGTPADEIRGAYHHASDYVLANLGWIIPLAAFLFLLVLTLCLLIIWLNSRGKFMFLHCVVWDKAEVDVPWHQYAAAANSLFWFRVCLAVAGMILVLPLVIFLLVDIIRMILQNEADFGGILLAVGLAVALIPLSIVFAVLRKFTIDFVVPIMFLRGATCMAAWREFWGLLSANPGKFTVYILFQIVLHIAIGAIVLAAILVTCCIAFCFLLVPFVGTVLLLPILVFKRAYSLYYLAQYGPQYDVFPKPAAAAIPPEPLPTPAA